MLKKHWAAIRVEKTLSSNSCWRNTEHQLGEPYICWKPLRHHIGKPFISSRHYGDPTKGSPYTPHYDSDVMYWGYQEGPHDGERRQSLGQLLVWSLLFFKTGQETACRTDMKVKHFMSFYGKKIYIACCNGHILNTKCNGKTKQRQRFCTAVIYSRRFFSALNIK